MGYDARRTTPPSQLANNAYRESYLYRFDAVNLSSVDTAIWPSVFDAGDGPALPRPAYVGPQGLWSDFHALSRAVEKSTVDVSIIAIQYVPTAATEKSLFEWLATTEPTTSLDASADWTFIGYDVADRFMVSSLLNCGLGSERHEIRLRDALVKDCVNERHLFRRLTDADSFVAISDDRIREHAPFFVYAVWE
jgi:hypothetical protein